MSEETLTIKIDSELKRELKLLSIKQNKTMSEIVSDLIQEYVAEND